MIFFSDKDTLIPQMWELITGEILRLENAITENQQEYDLTLEQERDLLEEDNTKSVNSSDQKTEVKTPRIVDETILKNPVKILTEMTGCSQSLPKVVTKSGPLKVKPSSLDEKLDELRKSSEMKGSKSSINDVEELGRHVASFVSKANAVLVQIAQIATEKIEQMNSLSVQAEIEKNENAKEMEGLRRVIQNQSERFNEVMRDAEEFLHRNSREDSEGSDVDSEAQEIEEQASVPQDKLMSLINNAVSQELKNRGLKEKPKQQPKFETLAEQIQQSIKIELVSNDNSIKRDYKLTKELKFDYFYGLLELELKSKDLLYVIDPKSETTVTDMKTLEKNKNRVREIIVNRIDHQTYFSKIFRITDPIKMLKELKMLKNNESFSTSEIIRDKLNSLQYNPAEESASDFWEKFDGLVREMENLPGSEPFSEREKRDAFYRAIKLSCPTIQTAQFLSQISSGSRDNPESKREDLSLDALRLYIIQMEADNRAREKDAPKTALNASRRLPQSICPVCHDFKHETDECPNKGKGRKCYKCKQLTFDHVGDNCPNPFKREPGFRQFRSQNGDRQNRLQHNGGHSKGRKNKNFKRKWESGDRDGYQNKKSKHSKSGRDNSGGSRRPNGKGGKPGWQKKQPKSGSGKQSSASESKRGNDTPLSTYFLVSKHYENRGLVEDPANLKYDDETSCHKSTLVKFLADSGATEHLTNTKLIFKSYNKRNLGKIRCANKDSSADLKTEGVGTVGVTLPDGSTFDLENVIYADALTENLLSLRRLVDSGLAVYLDDKKIDIYDPESNETFITGIYQSPYWLIELETDTDVKYPGNRPRPNQIFVNLSTADCNDKMTPRYITRSMTNKDKTQGITDNRVINSDTHNTNNDFSDDKTGADKESANLGSESLVNKDETRETNELPIQNVTKENLIHEHSNFDTTIWDREFHNVDELQIAEINELESPFGKENIDFNKNNRAMLWHVRMGHASISYLKSLQRQFPENRELQKAVFDKSIQDCEVCMAAKFNRLPFQITRNRATEPLQIIHSDLMGKISPATYPKGYKWIAVFVDDFSRLAMAYPMKTKTEAGYYLEAFVRTARNLLGRDAKVCYLRTDKGTEFTGGYTKQVLDKLGAEAQLTCPSTPEHNGTSERFNQTIQKKVRAYMFDSRLPENMWDLALGAAVYAYNRTPHKSNGMEVPLRKFAPNYSYDMNQIKRFGCLAFLKIQKKTSKFGFLGRKAVLVGYNSTGFQLLKPENGKYYESRDVRFNEKAVYGDKYGKEGIRDWPEVLEKIDKEKWFVEFDKEEENDQSNSSNLEGEDLNRKRENSSKPEGEQPKRKRGRPRKVVQSDDPPAIPTIVESTDNFIKDTSFSDLRIPENESSKVLFASVPKINEQTKTQDEVYHALLARINDDPTCYKEAMNSKDREFWQSAIDEELNSLKKNDVWDIVERPTTSKNRRKPNIIDSKWVFKRKLDPENKTKYKARLVIRGFKDKNIYDLMETYAPVSRLVLVRCVLAIINKYKLIARQLDVKTAFLNGTLEEEIYMEIPEGTGYSIRTMRKKVCKLKKALYGLKISPKRWYIRLSTVLLEAGLENDKNEPCLFYMVNNDLILILLFYVDDILLASNCMAKLNDIVSILNREFELSDLGEPKEFLGITIKRDQENRTIQLSQTNYIDKILRRFNFDRMHGQRTPMVTAQVANRERKMRETANDELTLSETSTPKNAPYREAVGSLLYLANATRPDISYAVNVLSRHQISPTEADWKMVIRVFRYLIETRNLALVYTGTTDDLQTYTDASFADCKGSLTTCGYVVKLFGDSIAWRTHKQTYVALSTCQAEYVAMSEACQEVIALNKTLTQILNRNFQPISLWCDNKAAEASAKTNGGNRLRHMTEVREDYVKECVELERVKIFWISSKDQIADIFTKPLSFTIHKRLTERIMCERSECDKEEK